MDTGSAQNNPESADGADQSENNSNEEFVAELLPTPSDGESTTQSAQPINSGVTYNPSVLVPPPRQSVVAMPSPMANLAAKGGAVGSFVLGVLAFLGSFISSYAIINSGLGIVLGLWGLSSNHRRLATVGLLLCTVSAFFCVVEISSWLQTIWPTEEI